jgi:hypothetical protein
MVLRLLGVSQDIPYVEARMNSKTAQFTENGTEIKLGR